MNDYYTSYKKYKKKYKNKKNDLTYNFLKKSN